MIITNTVSQKYVSWKVIINLLQSLFITYPHNNQFPNYSSTYYKFVHATCIKRKIMKYWIQYLIYIWNETPWTCFYIIKSSLWIWQDTGLANRPFIPGICHLFSPVQDTVIHYHPQDITSICALTDNYLAQDFPVCLRWAPRGPVKGHQRILNSCIWCISCVKMLSYMVIE